MNLHDIPFRIRAAAILALVFGACEIIQIIGLEIFTMRGDFHHHTIIFDGFLGSIPMLVLAYGIWNRRRWAWWLGMLLLGIPALTFQTEFVLSGNINGYVWLGHFVADSWVSWLTSSIGHPACMISALILATHYEDFTFPPPPDVRFPRPGN